RIELARQRNRLEVGVHLERKRLDVPLQRVTAGADRRGRMGGPVVILARSQKRYGGRMTPRSVMMAAISRAGVTSKAGLNTGAAPPRRPSAASRSSIGISAPEASVGSIVENGAAT